MKSPPTCMPMAAGGSSSPNAPPPHGCSKAFLAARHATMLADVRPLRSEGVVSRGIANSGHHHLLIDTGPIPAGEPERNTSPGFKVMIDEMKATS